MNQPYQIDRSKFMTESEVKRLLQTCADKADLDLIRGRTTWVTRYMLVHIALGSGLRVSELAALQLGDIHLSKTDSYLTVRHGKRDKRRDVYLSKGVASHLRAYIHDLRSCSPDAHLFGGRTVQLTTAALQHSFYQAVREAGLNGYSIHCARHTYATLLLAKNGNLRNVQKQLGHSSLNMTCLYADVLPEERQRLADTLTI